MTDCRPVPGVSRGAVLIMQMKTSGAFRPFMAVLLTLVAGNAFGETAAAALRARAREVFEPLPEKMPGAENDTRALAKLGEKLYFDKRLSADKTISCNSCHRLNGQGNPYTG